MPVLRDESDYYAEQKFKPNTRWVELEDMKIKVERPGAFKKGYEMTEEMKDAISFGLKGMRRDKSVRKSISSSLKGKKKSSGHKARLSDAMKGKKHTDGTRLKMAEAASSRNIIIGPAPGRQ